MINKNETIKKYFSEFKFLNDKLFYGKLPKEIFNECLNLAEIYRKSKDSPHAELKYLNNVGKNSYQVFPSISSIDDSFLLPYLHLLGVRYSNNQSMALKKTKNDYECDVYDIWYNYCYKGDVNSWHYHVGDLSGIIYIKNDSQPTIFEDGYQLIGKEEYVVIFPAKYQHCVDKKETEEERITLAFNLAAVV
jgi:hypothetical protein